jgi:hypothetical protein
VISAEMRDIAIGQNTPDVTVEENFLSLFKWTEHVACGQIVAAFISVNRCAHARGLRPNSMMKIIETPRIGRRLSLTTWFSCPVAGTEGRRSLRT